MLTNATSPTTEDRRAVSLAPEIQAMITEGVMERMDLTHISTIPRPDLVVRLEELVGMVIDEKRLQVNDKEQRAMAQSIADDMLGLGPLESLMVEDNITDVMINGKDHVFVERFGRVVLTDIKFRSEKHLREVATRIARSMNRPLDEAHPLLDARLADGSRVNIVIPPVSIDGTTISIRKFSRDEITLDHLAKPPPNRDPSISDKMRQFLLLAAKARLNIIISGGTSTGKTTMLNAISRGIDSNERIVTIEDAAELRLQQPHVVRLETRPKVGDVQGENIDQGRLVKNALRMRPDRIILGEVRGGEAFDLLAAMNTGHDGSLGTLHANTPRDALARLENMVLMAGFELPLRAIRNQISSAVEIVVQIERMADGARRVTHIVEVTGIEGEVISTQDLFHFEVVDQRKGKIIGEFVCSNAQLRCRDKLRRHGLESEAREIFSGRS